MKTIEVLGTGCPKCQKTTKLIENAMDELGVEANIEKVENINAISERGVMMTPAVAVDGEMKVSGKVPSSDEIKEWLQE